MDMSGITKSWQKHPLGMAAGAAALLGAAGWACFAGGGKEKTPVITIEEAREVVAAPEELSKLPEAERHRRLRAAGQAFGAEFGSRARFAGPPPPPPAEGRERGRKMRETMEKLSEADRAAFRSGMEAERRRQMQARQKEMDAKISAFFAAPAAEQERLLDEEVARMEEGRQQMEKFRAQMEKERAKSGKAGAGGPGGRGGPGGPGGPNGRPQPTREQREQWMRRGLDNSTPAERAQREEYFRRVRERAEAKRK